MEWNGMDGMEWNEMEWNGNGMEQERSGDPHRRQRLGSKPESRACVSGPIKQHIRHLPHTLNLNAATVTNFGCKNVLQQYTLKMVDVSACNVYAGMNYVKTVYNGSLFPIWNTGKNLPY